MTIKWKWHVNPDVPEGIAYFLNPKNIIHPAVNQETGAIDMNQWTSAIYKGYETPPEDEYDLRRVGLLPGGHQPDEAMVAYSDGYGKDPWLYDLREQATHLTIDIYHRQMRDMQRALTVAQDELAKAQANAQHHALVAEQRKRALIWLDDVFEFYEKNSDEVHQTAKDVIQYSVTGELD